jgi:hypothetical protein
MKTILSNSLKVALALLLVVAFFASGVSPAGSAAAACSPTPAATFDVYAKTGTATVYGTTTVTIWGYASGPSGATDPATLPGPVLTVNQGDCVQVTLHNGLPEASALNFQGQSLVPDTTGAAAGGTRVYTFAAATPGTFLYEAGLIPGKQHQVGMGLYGALVVNSSTSGTAYGTPATAFDQANVLVLSEFDPALAAAPTSFDMRNYAPRYFLINGKAYTAPFTGDIPVTAGSTVLLRYVNAGLQSHAMSTLGIAQRAVATDGHALAYPHNMVTETIATGQTLDALVTIPAAAASGTRYAAYDAALMLRNANAAGLGGMLTFLTVGAGVTPPPGGPLTSGVTLSPSATNGSAPVTLSATIGKAGDPAIDTAEYFADAVGANGSGCAITTGLGGAPANVSIVIPVTGGAAPCVNLTALSSVSHTFYVHGHNSSGWGASASALLTLDKAGPSTSSVGVSPVTSNGSLDVALSASASDVTSGNSNITAAEYNIDGGAAAAMTVNLAAPTASLSAILPAAAVNALTEGSHSINVRSQDVFGNWGAYASTTLTVDKTGPGTSSVLASPNPNSGTKPFNTSIPAVRVTASFSDPLSGGANSNVVAAEGFIDTVAANGTGFVFIATDGTFNSPAETGYSDIPLPVVSALSAGNHTIYVHAKDAAGNWGATSTTILVIDKIPPTATSITRAGATPTNAASVPFLVTFSENVTGLASGNFTVAASGITGASVASLTNNNNNTWTVTVNTGSGSGTLGLNLTSTSGVMDVAGNTLSSTGIPLTGQTYAIDKTAPTLTSISLSPSSFVQGAVTNVTLTATGASDAGGSGLNGGEYWVNPPTSSTPAPGSGTAFSGTTASIPVGTYATGTYTVSARMKDGVGNWGVIRSATLNVVTNNIFADGFESGNFSAWSSRSTTSTTRLTVNAASAMVGSFGMQAQGNNTNYVQNNFTPVSATYDARFYFRPNGNTSTGKDIFAAATTSGFNNMLFRVRYRLNGSTPQVQIRVGNTNNASWTNILGGTSSNYLEVLWTSGGSLQLYVNGTLSQTLTAGTGSVAAVRMGSVTNTGNATAMYFDAFFSKRLTSPVVGP